MRAGACLVAAAIALLTVLALEMPGIIQAAVPGTITGVMTNGTSRRPVPNAEPSLLEMGAGGADVMARGRTDGAGRFRFAGVDPSGGRTFLVTTMYKGVPYSSDALRFTARRPAVSVEISVFELTSDPSVVVAAFRVIMVQRVLPGRLVIRDVIGLQSREPRALIGQETGADQPPRRGIECSSHPRGGAPAVAASVVVDALPITPRVREAVLQYEVGYLLTRAALRWPLDYPTVSVDLILPEGVQVRAVNLAAQPAGQVRGQRLLRFTAEQVPAGRDVRVDLAGLPTMCGPTLSPLPACCSPPSWSPRWPGRWSVGGASRHSSLKGPQRSVHHPFRATVPEAPDERRDGPLVVDIQLQDALPGHRGDAAVVFRTVGDDQAPGKLTGQCDERVDDGRVIAVFVRDPDPAVLEVVNDEFVRDLVQLESPWGGPGVVPT